MKALSFKEKILDILQSPKDKVWDSNDLFSKFLETYSEEKQLQSRITSSIKELQEKHPQILIISSPRSRMKLLFSYTKSGEWNPKEVIRYLFRYPEYQRKKEMMKVLDEMGIIYNENSLGYWMSQFHKELKTKSTENHHPEATEKTKEPDQPEISEADLYPLLCKYLHDELNLYPKIIKHSTSSNNQV